MSDATEPPTPDGVPLLGNGLVNRYPAIGVPCAGAADVAAAVQFADEHGTDLSPGAVGGLPPSETVSSLS